MGGSGFSRGTSALAAGAALLAAAPVQAAPQLGAQAGATEGTADAATTAPAQDARPGDGGPDDGSPDDGGIADIVVTAQRRAENINDVAMSIQAFGGAQLTALGITDASGLAQVTPAFNFARSSANTPIYTIRGVGFQTPNLSSTSPVGIYVDEVAYAFPYMSNGPAFDIERVEVLKGPQGTLYGRNTTGGLVNYITARPGSVFSTGMTAEGGNFGTFNVEGFVNVPLTPTMGLRVSGRWETASRGWQQSVTRPGDRLGEKDRLGVRGVLEWRPTDRLSLLLTASYWEDRSDTIAAQAVSAQPDAPPFAVPGLAGFTRTDWRAGEADWGPVYPGKPPYRADSSFRAVSGRIDYALGETVTLTSLTGYNNVRRLDMNDIDGTPFEVNEYMSDGRIRSLSQELRLTGESGALDWIVGGYYSRDDIRDDQIGYFRDASVLNQLAFVGQLVPQTVYTPEQVANGFDTFRNLSSQRNRSLSAFANGDLALTGQFTLSAGLRYSDDRLSFRGCSADFDNNTAPVWNTGVAQVVALRTGRPFAWPGVEPNGCLTYRADFSGRDPIYERRLDEDNLAGRVALNWSPHDDMLLYASVSRGFKSGAFPVVAANVETQFAPAVQERVTAYEAGVKATLANRRVQANAAAYYYDYRDKQLFGEIPDPIFNSLTRIINVPDSRVWGAEADLTVRPVAALTLRVNGSYTDTKVLEFIGINRFGRPEDFAGSAFPFTPRWQFNGLASYDLPVGGGNVVQLMANASRQGRTPGALGEEAVFDIAAYTLVNGTITFRSADDRWRIGVFGRNIFNENYYTTSDVITDTIIRVPGMVRTYGVSISHRY